MLANVEDTASIFDTQILEFLIEEAPRIRINDDSYRNAGFRHIKIPSMSR